MEEKIVSNLQIALIIMIFNKVEESLNLVQA
jgi:hypothetical protein